MVSNIPGGIVAPLLAFDVESGGQFQSETRMILLGHGTSAGTLAAGAIALCGSVAQARLLAGRGSMLESMFIRARRNAPAQEIWLGRVADGATAQVRTITLGTPPAAGGQGVVSIAGEDVSLNIAAGDSAATVAAALRDAINAYINPVTKISLPFTATASTNVVTLTARHGGTSANGIDIHVPLLEGANAFTGLFTFAVGTAGAGVPDVAAVLAAMGDDAFEIVVSAFGDDANRVKLDNLHSNVSGRWSYAQQLYGHVCYPRTDTVANLATAGLAPDSWHLSLIPLMPAAAGMARPDYEFVAAIVARVAPFFDGGSNGLVSVNQSNLEVSDMIAPRDRDYWPDYATRDSLLKNGVSTWKVDRSGRILIDKIITQQQTTNGVPDTALRDIQAIYQITYALKYFRSQLAFEHSNKAIVDDNPANLDALRTVKDIRATLVNSTIELQQRGVLEASNAVLDEITVTRNADNPNRVDIILPMDRANPLDIFAGLARVYAET
ncbi:phage tail sheath subtilisin-like domain-containing protein [Nostoc sp. NIES-2111]